MTTTAPAQPTVCPDPAATRPAALPTRTERVLALAAPGHGPSTAEQGHVEVRVLGPVEVAGAARPLRRAWTTELVVYLALHPRGATTDEWCAALWPDRLAAPATVQSIASAARRALGSTDGEDHLPRQRGGLHLAPTVRTDWSLFGALSAGGPDERRAALRLVRGRPFDGLRSSDWCMLEGFVAEVEQAVADLALGLAWEALRDGSGGEAVAMIRRALLACPYDERLYRALLRGIDASGNRMGLRQVMGELAVRMGESPPPATPATPESPLSQAGPARPAVPAVHPRTLELYRRLSTGGSPRTQGETPARGPNERSGQVAGAEAGRRSGKAVASR